MSWEIRQLTISLSRAKKNICSSEKETYTTQLIQS